MSDFFDKLSQDPAWIGGLASIAGRDPQQAIATAQQMQMQQAQLQQSQEAAKAQRLLGERLAQAGGNITPELVAETMRYNPQLGMRMRDQLMRQQQQAQRQQMLQSLPMFGGGSGAQQVVGASDQLAAIAVATGDPTMMAAAQFAYQREKDSPEAIASRERASQSVSGTKGEQALDAAFGKEYADYVAGGGYAGTEKQLGLLKGVLSQIEGENPKNLSSPYYAFIPDSIMGFVNPSAMAAKEDVQSAVQASLRQTLGAQYTQKEGEDLMKRAYNPNLDEKANAKRLKSLINQIEQAARTKREAAEYFEKNGTLQGWRGKIPSINDFSFDDEVRPQTKQEQPTQGGGVPEGVDPILWNVMKPEERKLWK